MPFTDRLRQTALPVDAKLRSFDDLALAAQLSPRTLRRRLKEEGTSYSALVEQEKKQQALLLLRTTDLSIKEISDRLGYSSVANFARTFRRWTGKTPAASRSRRA